MEVKIKNKGEEKKYFLSPGETLFEMLIRQENYFLSFCGGRGMCGKCKIQFLSPPPMPHAEERKFLTPEELRKGIRLACLARPKEDCVISILFEEEKIQEMDLEQRIVASYIPAYVDQEQKDFSESQMVAIDLGTTTIVLQLLEIASGKICSERRVLNPQRTWGADVLSRMEASIQGKREVLRDRTIHLLEQEISSLTKDENISIVIAANTVMEHILMGFDVSGLSVYPFLPVSLEQMQITIGCYHATLMPGISGFVGADIMAGIYALHMHQSEEINLLLDLGTNGEMVIGNRDKLLATATAAGPAFEGGTLASVQGTDMIAQTAKMLQKGILDETGLMEEPYFHEGYQVKEFSLQQADIRNLQMAKAAIHAGVEVLLEQMQVHIEQIGQVFLAGGFGYYLDVECANRIGLLPKGMQQKTKAVGNTSLYGAYLYGKAQWQAKERGIEDWHNTPKEIIQIKNSIKTINLAEQESFEGMYIAAMHF